MEISDNTLVYTFGQAFLTTFMTLFIYTVLNLFISLIVEAHEESQVRTILLISYLRQCCLYIYYGATFVMWQNCLREMAS